MPRAFVIRPFKIKRDLENKERDFDRVYTELIAPALQATGMGGGDTGEIIEAGNIRGDMFPLIFEADVVICDVTLDNANVFYELGVRHALRRGKTILIRAKQVSGAAPFDILTERQVRYDIDDPRHSVAPLIKVIEATQNKENEVDSPVFAYIPDLPERLHGLPDRVPQELKEEIGRAQASKMPGWLRLLATEVTNMRFEWAALRQIGAALTKVGDLEEATRCWERVKEQFPNDVEANIALGNLYQRAYRKSGLVQQLTSSDDALARALSAANLAREQRSEGLAQCGRNKKTRWHSGWKDVPPEQRRVKAISERLLSSYENYRKAFDADLNNYWPGLAALQMLTVALDLSREPQWRSLRAARTTASAHALEEEIAKLTVAVSMAIAAAREAGGEKKDLWAEISEVDLRFLAEDDADALALAYLDAIPANEVFAWGAARDQLALFSALGVRAELANEVIRLVDAELPHQTTKQKPDIVIFVGHMVDAPARPSPRFPAGAVEAAYKAIRSQLEEMARTSSALQVFASVAPGGDILCHEACDELKIESVACLPMPKDEFVEHIHGKSDEWRRRYLNIVERRVPLQLSERRGLPRWLRGSVTDPWHRGNRWVLEMARASSTRVTLVALWDEVLEDTVSGTADMVQMARRAGVNVVILDTKAIV
jgi:hypothetical protein